MPNLRAHMVYSRFGLGPRPGDLAALGDPVAALLAELDAGVIGLPGKLLDGSAQIYAAARETLMQERQQRRAEAATGLADNKADREASTDVDTPAPDGDPQTVFLLEVRRRLMTVKQADIGFVERLVSFWTNHFAIATRSDKQVLAMAGAYEREAIRPHVLGKFGDMVLAATQHPAMLIYLNNAVSIGPDSPQGERHDRGLNENHARELMELHTLGVDGGYSQGDVTAFAKVLTGWSVGSQPQQSDNYGRFLFRSLAHEPGPQTVLGKVYGQDGVEQGEAVLADLAANPATATHIATKFARHFSIDEPDAGLVERLAAGFIQSGGNLKQLAIDLVEDDAAWSSEATKLRTPQEFVWSAARAIDVQMRPRQIIKILDDLGQSLWNPPSPEGFKDDLASWLAPGAMTDRLDAAELMAGQAQGTDDPRQLAADLFGDALSPETTTAIGRAESSAQGIALLLMSPEFQRR